MQSAYVFASYYSNNDTHLAIFHIHIFLNYFIPMFTDSVHQNKSVQFFKFEVVDSYNLVTFGGEKVSRSERKGTKLAR